MSFIKCKEVSFTQSKEVLTPEVSSCKTGAGQQEKLAAPEAARLEFERQEAGALPGLAPVVFLASWLLGHVELEKHAISRLAAAKVPL